MTKVLIVDDDEEIRSLLQDMLLEEGFRVDTARDGQEALDLLEHESGWIILLDIMMPNVDGREVIRQLQASQKLREQNRVALMSAGGRLAQERLHLATDVVEALLPKPFDLEDVLAVVSRLAQ
ncbi:MAG TPA: response regulator [Ktedonobacterales bacterium]|nr:response regulator [Ktedonobacterales bacterium]